MFTIDVRSIRQIIMNVYCIHTYVIFWIDENLHAIGTESMNKLAIRIVADSLVVENCRRRYYGDNIIGDMRWTANEKSK